MYICFINNLVNINFVNDKYGKNISTSFGNNLEAILQTALLCINIKYIESEMSIFGRHVNHCCPLQYKKMLEEKIIIEILFYLKQLFIYFMNFIFFP